VVVILATSNSVDEDHTSNFVQHGNQHWSAAVLPCEEVMKRVRRSAHFSAQSRNRQTPELWKGVASGALAGVSAAWVMNQYQKLWSKASEALAEKQNSGAHREQDQSSSDKDSKKSEDSENSTTKVAAAVAQPLLPLWRPWLCGVKAIQYSGI
jgi:hypothetical protein